jgi:hypothetical protein
MEGRITVTIMLRGKVKSICCWSYSILSHYFVLHELRNVDCSIGLHKAPDEHWGRSWHFILSE